MELAKSNTNNIWHHWTIGFVFYSLWITYGLMLWTKTDGEESEDIKSSVTLSWCIVQSVCTVIVPLCIFVGCSPDADEQESSLSICKCFDEDYSMYSYGKEHKSPSICEYISESSLLVRSVVPIFFTVFGIKDIVAVIIAFSYNCNQAVDGDDPFIIGSIDINSWILVAGLSHFMMISIGILMCCRPERSCVISSDPSYEEWPMQYSLLFIGMADLFSVLWLVFGFINWSQMDPDHVCSKMVLSWSIIEIFFSCFPCVTVCCYYRFCF